MLSSGPSHGGLASRALPTRLGSGPAAAAAAPVRESERGNLHHPRGPVAPSEQPPELDDGQGSDPSMPSAAIEKLSPIRKLEFEVRELGAAKTLESIPEIPTISVSAATSPERLQTAADDGLPRTTSPHPAQTTLLPPRKTPSRSNLTPSPSPSTAPPAASSWWKLGGLGMAFTGDSQGRESDARKSKIGTWWSGADSASSSARSSRILTTPPSLTTTTTPSAVEVPAITRLRKSHTVGPTPERNNNSNASALSSFTTMISRRLTTQPAVTYAPDDELCTMDLEAALPSLLLSSSSPSSSPSLSSTPSPGDYDLLQAQALSLLSRFQTAYKAQSAALRDLQAEHSAEREEQAQLSAHARHLRAKLDDAVRRASEHEAAMAAILEELNAEKRARLDLERVKGSPGSEGSVITEDLAVEEDQRREGDETDEESIFSRSRSPTMTEVEGSFGLSPSRARGGATAAVPRPRRTVPLPQQQQQQQRLTAFQKIIKGISGDEAAVAPRCGNCAGGDARVAWDTVSLLRDENKALKQRVGALEVAVEGALDAVNGVGM
ncbi:uncharacterized protein DNG_01425 [Cephalotrichum gorgonifer]|uniref:Uncharacterized protein n=1 Tax=Cephalotrichum gorgonifer TaxID=2041049 RepID=A0AAE8MQW6_9PEZI|nr:uncharacterized protein DNG_01425 [Cephalotrichum gorgonifer]